jgi:Tol biopolymer transport system component/DNA-binding winged helix-turn-helix (wHTH) protein
MSLDTSDNRICRFGLYEADLDAGTLKRHGIPVKLQEQPFRVLGFLLERPGQIISREELRNRLWPEGTYVEFDGSVNTALMKLRAVLNDDSENPRFIETVPKKGYRFIAPVQVLGPLNGMAETTPAAVLPPDPQLQKPTEPVEMVIPNPVEMTARRNSPLLGLALFFAGVAATSIAIWRYWPVAEPVVTKVTQLTHSGRVAPDSRIVTDGARLYFVSREGGQGLLMTTSIRGGSVEKIASPFESTTLFDLSPDRTQLLIGPFTHQGDSVPLWIWPAHGGVPHRLGDVTATEACWSPIGDLIAFTQGNRLLTVRRDGSDTKELKELPALPHTLVWSSDGISIRFTLTNLDTATDDMWEIGANGKGLRRILPNLARELHDTTGAWSSDDRYFLFTGGSDSHISQVMDSVSNVWSLREHSLFLRAKRPPSELTHGPVSYRNLAGTGDSDRFFALGTHPEYQLIRVNPVTSKDDVILPDAGATDVDVSPDGEWLVYSLRENGALWKSRRNGKERVELTPLPPGALGPQWSPDANEVLFTAFFLEKRPQLYVVPSAGGTPRTVLPSDAEGSTRSGDWSPDGKKILFDYAERGRSDVRILDRDSAQIETLPDSEALVEARWSPDGQHIAAINSKTHQIVLYSLQKKAWSVIARASNAQGMRWSADSNFVYYQELADPEQAVYRVRLAPSSPEKILGFSRLLGSMASQCHFTGVAPDGSIYATVDRGGTDLYALDLKLP